MGIHRFMPWFKTTFDRNIKYLIKSKPTDVKIDNLMIDLNGIIHTSAQKIYEYGNYKSQPRILSKDIKYINKQLKVYEDICDNINILFNYINPTKRLIICIDGPAPQSKQTQQRKRRFKSSLESQKSVNEFDGNSITPGTKFMDTLSKYIDHYIRKMSKTNDKWKNVSIIFSNEKVPGEGEHKAISFVRNNSIKNPKESYCLHGLDSDLVMLTLGTQVTNFYILRDETYNMSFDYSFINIGGVREQLINMMNWEHDVNDFNEITNKFIDNNSINDFILICFMIGNDFLPQIPSIEILNGGINLILDLYRFVCKDYGHITSIDKLGNSKINLKPIIVLLAKIGEYEKDMMIMKLSEKTFPDEILDTNKFYDPIKSSFDINIIKYKEDYYKSKFPIDTSIKDICHSYLEGMQWVLAYYTKGVLSWNWMYKFNYAPFTYDMALYLKDYVQPKYLHSTPNTPFQQLMCVLPPNSSNLIPYPLCYLLIDEESPIIEFYPNTFSIDLSGKHKEYEGIVILPAINTKLLEDTYYKYITKVNEIDLKRNKFGKTYIYYSNTDKPYTFISYYGDINSCITYTSFFDI